jgi:hypothetical protein
VLRALLPCRRQRLTAQGPSRCRSRLRHRSAGAHGGSADGEKDAKLGVAILEAALHRKRQFHLHGYAYTWYNQHLNDSTLTADIRAYDRGACKGRATTTNMEMGQDWTGYSCSFNPSISVSIPWAISVGFWPSCGNRTQAEHHHFYPGKY